MLVFLDSCWSPLLPPGFLLVLLGSCWFPLVPAGDDSWSSSCTDLTDFIPPEPTLDTSLTMSWVYVVLILFRFAQNKTVETWSCTRLACVFFLRFRFHISISPVVCFKKRKIATVRASWDVIQVLNETQTSLVRPMAVWTMKHREYSLWQHPFYSIIALGKFRISFS